MSWLSKAIKKVQTEVVDDALGSDSEDVQKVIKGIAGGSAALLVRNKKKSTSVVGPTDAEVLASDERTRRRLAGKGSTLVSGGLAGKSARVTMPTLVGV